MGEEASLNLLELGEKVVKAGLRLGVEEIEVYLSRTSTIEVEVERNQIVKGVKFTDEGFGVRVVYNHSIGFSYTNRTSKEKLEDVIVKAISAAKAGKPDKNWKGFPKPSKIPETKNTYDKRVAELSLEEVVELTSTMLNSALEFDKRVLAFEGLTVAGESLKALVNSNGINYVDKGTGIECFLSTIAKDDGETTPVCFEFEHERIYRINPEKVGVEAAKQAVSSLGAKSIKTGTYEVIFGQHALASLLHHTLVGALKADNVQRGKSKLKDKLNQKIASEKLTIVDDGLFNGGLNTWKFDDEGTISQKTVLVEKGVLKNFLYDKYTADKDSVESTGNAQRISVPPYTSTPYIEPTNFVILPGKHSQEELFTEVSKGIYVSHLQGAHSSNPESGEFSVIATPAWMIEKGELAYPLKGVMLAGIIYDFLKDITGIANSLRKVGFLVAPLVRVANVRVVGR